MITVGYCTIPEAVILLKTHGKLLEHLTAAMLLGELRVYVQVPVRDGDWEICRVPREDLHALSEQGWESWLPTSGRVPAPPEHIAYRAARAASPFDGPPLERPKPMPK
jgi:hypothetical protein